MIGMPPAQTPPELSSAGVVTRRRFLKLATASVVGLAVYAGEIERHDIQVVPRTIALDGLPDAFAGFRIVQISDIHLVEYTEATFLKLIVRMTNALRPDLVVLTGDFISERPLPSRFAVRWGYECAEILSRLNSTERYAVLGNHDVTVNAPAVTDALVSHRIPVLENRFVPIERDRSRIWLAGVADPMCQHPDLSLALPRQRRPDREPVILLSHEPDYADAVVGRGASLVLSGHTHGGQIRIPWMRPLFLPGMGRKYLEGHFLLADGTQLYVNRGIGTVNLPFRFRCPPELTLITLTRT
ncbi:MAG TPA: metallophosphoesterase [Acidobacteriaceae bacterium]